MNVIGNEIKHIKKTWRNSATPRKLCVPHCHYASGQDLINRVSNIVYEDCRSGRLVLPSFPQFDVLLQALKNGQNNNQTKTFRVTAQIHNQLLVLESLAKRWMNDELTAEKANAVITAHNEEFNNTGDFWSSERTACQSFPVVFSSVGNIFFLSQSR